MQILPIRLFNGANQSFKGNSIPIHSHRNYKGKSKEDTFSKTRTARQTSPISLEDKESVQKEINSAAQSIKTKFEQVSKEAREIYRQMERTRKQAGGAVPCGMILRKISSDETQEVLEELSDSGNIARRTTIINNDGDVLCTVEEGIRTLPDGTKEIAKKAAFRNSQPLFYAQNHRILPDGSETFDKKADFRFGEPSYYLEGYEKLKDGTLRRDLEIECTGKHPSYYLEGFERLGDGTVKLRKEIYFKDKKVFAGE